MGKQLESWLKGALRRASMRWPPIYTTRKNARVARGKYRCAGYGRGEHIVPLTLQGKANTFVDHIIPVGKFIDWNTYIKNLFCDSSNLQILCRECHDRKTKDESRSVNR